MKNYPFYEPHKIETLKELVEVTAKAYGEKTAFQFEQKRNMICVSYSAFQKDVEGFGAYLRHEGYAQHRIALLGENSYAWILSHFAVACSGNVVVPIDKELSAEEALELIKASDCSALICSLTYWDIAEHIRETGMPVYGMDRINQMVDDGCAFCRENDGNEDYVPGKNDLATIVFTSGTTGQSKGVMLTHGNLAVDAYGAACSVCLEGTTLLLLPLHHTFGLVAAIYFEMLRGNTVYINRSLKRLTDDLRKCRPQHLMAVPLIAEQLCHGIWANAKKQEKDRLLRMLVRVSNALRVVGVDVRRKLFRTVHEAFGGNLECIVSGGAPISEATIKALDDFGIQVLNGYGITECAPIVAVNRNRFVVPGSVGVPLICNEVRIAEDGEVLVRGANVMQGYYRNEQATKAAFDGEWFRTGDLGRIDEHGTLHIVGRKKNLIILSNGENIPAEELEMKLMALPGVLEAVVSGKNDTIAAELYLDPDQPDAKNEISELIQNMNKTLPQNRNITEYTLRCEPFPKTTTKKIKRESRG